MIERIDRWILVKIVEPLSHRIERHTGANNIRQSYVCLGFSFVLLMLATYGFWQLSPMMGVGDTLYFMLFAIIVIAAMLKLAVRNYFLDQTKWQRDPLISPGSKYEGIARFFRVVGILMCLVMASLLVDTLIRVGWEVLATTSFERVAFFYLCGMSLGFLAEYLSLCRPPPPERESVSDGVKVRV